MDGLGAQIVVGLTAILSFLAGIVAELIRHRLSRTASLKDERFSIYSQYLSATMRGATAMLLSGALTQSESTQDLLQLTREDEKLVGPVRLLANDEVRAALTDVGDSYNMFYAQAVELHGNGHEATDAVLSAWARYMRPAVERLEREMKAHLNLD